MSTPKKSTQIEKAKALPVTLPPTLLNLRVVDRCCAQAWAAEDEALAEGKGDAYAKDMGRRVFRASMPAPLDPESTGDFINCVTFGVIAGLFSLKEANTLCYAAQLALSAHRARHEAEKG